MSEEDLCDLISAVVRQEGFTERNTELNERRKLLFQDRKVEIPGISLKTTFESPEIEEDAADFQSSMLAAAISIDVTAKKEQKTAQEAAVSIEKFCKAHDVQWRADGVYDGPLFDQAGLAAGVLHLAINPDALPSPLEKGDTEDRAGYLTRVQTYIRERKGTIFHLESLPFDTLYWTPDKSIYFSQSKVPLIDVQDQYRRRGYDVSLDKTGDNILYAKHEPGSPEAVESGWDREVVLTVLESNDYCYHVLAANADKPEASKVIGTYRNFFGAPQFYIIPGRRTGDRRPLYAYRPLLIGKYRTVPIKNLLKTALTSAGVEASQRRFSLEWIGLGDEPVDQKGMEVMIGPDGALIPPAGYRVVAAQLEIGMDLVTSIQLINSEDRYGFPEALGRPEEVSATSGYDRAKIETRLTSLMEPALGQFSTAKRGIFLSMLTAVREIGIPVTVRTVRTAQAKPEEPKEVEEEITLDPEDAQEVYLRVSHDATTLYSLIARQEEGMKQVEAGVKTLREFLQEDRRVDDPHAWFRAKTREDVMKFTDALVVKDVMAAIESIRGYVMGEATRPPLGEELADVAAGQAGGGEAMTASIPTGVGTAMPLEPPVPAEVTQPTGAEGTAVG